MCATLSEHVKIVKELLLAKADPNLKIKVSDLKRMCVCVCVCVCVCGCVCMYVYVWVCVCVCVQGRSFLVARKPPLHLPAPIVHSLEVTGLHVYPVALYLVKIHLEQHCHP